MSSVNQVIRQGLPRVAGGEPWPPAELFAEVASPAVQADAVDASPQPEPVAEPAVVAQTATSAAASGALRQGLPRVAGGEPWPPSGTLISAGAIPPVMSSTPDPAPVPVPERPSEPVEVMAPAVAAQPSVAPASAAIALPAPSGDGPVVRRGLPRIVGGEPWPPASFKAVPLAAEVSKIVPTPEPQTVEEPVVVTPPVEAVSPAPQVAVEVEKPAQPAPKPDAPQPVAPKSATAPAGAAKTKKEPVKHGPLTTKQWVLAGILGAFCALGIATAVVLVARGIAGFDAVAAFIERYPGEYHLPESAPVGIPAWLAWNHFFNLFLMVLIIRSGMLVRHQKKPPAYWSSKRRPKVSINLWLHQGLDLLWLINGLVFIILLFATGHWMRVIPTSWEVFPNAISATLQYLTLDWPTENGWVNYNALQQLAYFMTIFIAAPLAAITGFRLSAFWPKNAAGLTKRYPIEVARALHFPTMLYFVLFIVVHVVLVFSTGALRNLNHMYAAQGSVDPSEYANNWVGLLFFALSLLVIAGAWLACRPLLLAPIAGVFGKVSSR